MEKLMLLRSIMHNALLDFKKHFFVISLLTIIFAAINFLVTQVGDLYSMIAVEQYDFLSIYFIRIVQAGLGAIGYVFFVQNFLDLVYERPMSWFKISKITLYAIMIDAILYYISKFKGLDLSFPWQDIITSFTALGAFQIVMIVTSIFLFSLLSYALLFRCLFIDLFILEAKCSIKQAVNKSWDLALGNASLYALCFFIPALMRLVILFITGYYAGANYHGMVCAHIIAWLIFAWSLLLRVHLFKTLAALKKLE